MDKRKIKIGINASFARKPNTGIGQVTVNFLQKLVSFKNNDLEFIVYSEEKLPGHLKLSEKLKSKMFLPTYKRDDLIRKIWWEKFSLPRQAKKDGCDIFLSLYQCPTVISGTPHIMVVHDIIPEIFPEYLDNVRKEIYWRLTKSAIKKTDRIVAISKNTEKDLINRLGIDAGKIAASYISIDEAYKKKVSQKESGRVLKKYKLKPGYIFAGGGYEIRKNVEGVIRAYKLLLEKNKNLRFVEEIPRLVIYGKILPPSLSLALDVKKLLQELNLTKQVRLLGAVSQKDLPALFSNAKFFVYPSFYEGFGMPVLEAMSSGTPAITSKRSSLPEVGLDSVLYCHPEDTRDIAMVMRSLLTKENLREEIARRGIERAKNFSWTKFAKKILNIAGNLR